MVGNHTHGHVYLLVFAVFQARQARNLLYNGLENIGVVVGCFALQRANKAFETHTRIDNVHRQGLQRAVGLAIKLHKHDVPYLDNLRIILVYEACARHFGLFFGRTRVEMYLRTGAAWTRFAHLPEVVVLVSVDDMVGR